MQQQVGQHKPLAQKTKQTIIFFLYPSLTFTPLSHSRLLIRYENRRCNASSILRQMCLLMAHAHMCVKCNLFLATFLFPFSKPLPPPLAVFPDANVRQRNEKMTQLQSTDNLRWEGRWRGSRGDNDGVREWEGGFSV